MKSFPAPRCGRSAATALALYITIAFTVLGRPLSGEFDSLHLGRGVDSSFLMWALVWWPYAITHALNPFLCKLVWAPAGFNLAWSGGLPLAAMAAAPLTRIAGPIASYNFLTISAVVIAAWSCFILCRNIGGSFGPAFLGGYLFGFSPYMLGQAMGGHLNLMFVFPAPLIASLALRALTRDEPSFVSIPGVALLLVVQFLLSIELAATLVLFGGLALILGWLEAGSDQRVRIRALASQLAQAGALSAVLLAPYLYYLFLPDAPHSAINSPGGYSADLANLVVPTPTMQLGALPGVEAIALRFPGNLGERGAYFGLPLLCLIFRFGWTRWSDAVGRCLVCFFLIVLVFALGPRLRIVGWSGFGMPWKIATHLPMIKNALPARLANYGFLAAAMIATLWLSDAGVSRAMRVMVASLIVLSLMPNLDRTFWVSPTPIPEFFANGLYWDYLRPGETVVALPFGIAGNTMLWQATAAMQFRMAGGYTGMTTHEFESWPAVRMLITQTYTAETSEQLLAMMVAHDADLFVVAEEAESFWGPALVAIDPAPRHRGGVWLYRVNSDAFDRYRNVTALMMERRDVDARFAAEIAAAQRYLTAGHNPSELTPWHAQQLGLLPRNWVNDQDVRTGNGLYLGPWPHDRIAIGIVGSYPALKPLIERYRSQAKEVYFPFPRRLEEPVTGDNFMRLLVIVFDRKSIADGAIAALQFSIDDRSEASRP